MKTARPIDDVEAKKESVEAVPDAVNVDECGIPETESTKPTEPKGNDSKRTCYAKSKIPLKKDLMVSIDVPSSLVSTQIVGMWWLMMAEKRMNNEFLFSILRSNAKSVTNEEVEHDKSR